MFLAVWLTFAVGIVHAAAPAKSTPAPTSFAVTVDDPNLAVIRAILEQPEGKIDLTRAKLTIDHMVDPSVDIEKTVSIIEGMAATENKIIPPDASIFVKMQTLRQYLYLAGPWNDNNIFRYNFDDPLGTDVQDMLLPHYLETHKGQCVSMPLLFLFLAQRMGMTAALAEAPKHTFVMLRGDDGNWLNLETVGNGAPTRLETYQRSSPMTQAALDNGVYMRPLSNRETVATMAEELLSFYAQSGRHDNVAALADLLVHYHPKSVSLLIYESQAYENIVRRDFMAKYPTSNDIPLILRARFNGLAGVAYRLRQQAVELGYQPETKDAQQAAARRVAQAKADYDKDGGGQ